MVQIQTLAQEGFFLVLNFSVKICEVSQGWISLPMSWMLYVSLLATSQKTSLNWLGPWILHLRSFYVSESLSLFIVNAHLSQLNFDLATILLDVLFGCFILLLLDRSYLVEIQDTSLKQFITKLFPSIFSPSLFSIYFCACILTAFQKTEVI